VWRQKTAAFGVCPRIGCGSLTGPADRRGISPPPRLIRSGLRFYWLALGVLTVWRVTHLLKAEDGPWDLMVRIRHWAGYGLWGRLLDCFYCLSLWVAVPFAYWLGEQWKERMLLWPALSGAAILLERLTSDQGQAQRAAYTEDEEGNDVLRQKQDTISRGNHEFPSS